MRLRVPPFRFHRYNFKFISHNFGDHTFQVLKKWIDFNYKFIKCKAQLQFLTYCKRFRIFPSHLTVMFKNQLHLTHYKSVRRIETLMHTLRTRILKIEIFDLHRRLDYLKKSLGWSAYFLSNHIPLQMWNDIVAHHTYAFRNFHYKMWSQHKNKFEWLKKKQDNDYCRRIRPIEFSCKSEEENKIGTISFVKSNINTDINVSIQPSQFVNKMRPNILNTTNEKWFINLSNANIPSEVSCLLQLGEKFSIPFISNKKRTIHEFVKDLERNYRQHMLDNQITIRNIAVPQFHKILHNKTNITPIERNLLIMHKHAVTYQRENPNVIFTRADKGNVTVALNKDDYTQKIESLLCDNDTYSTVKKNPSLTIEKELNNLLKKWLKKEYISPRDYYSMHSSDSNLPKAYGLPKIHKENVPFRIIVSSINTALYPLAAFLQKILAKSLPKPKSHVNNSFELCIDLSKLMLDDSEILVSLDVVSLFTNVPTELVIEGITKRWEFIKRKTGLPLKEFVKAMEFVLSSTFFVFNNKIYKQTFGSPMGSPLSPSSADIVMEDLEDEILNILSTLGIRPSFYRRYVDDIIMAVRRENVLDIFNRFNNYHDRIKFTIEYEENRSISFLDVKLIVRDNLIVTDWFHKKTFSGRFLSFYSSHPTQHKLGTIYSLVDRAIRLSHPNFFNKNLLFIINCLLENGYPMDLIFTHINLRIKKLVNQSLNDSSEVLETQQKKNFFVLPYIKSFSELIASKVDKSNINMGYRILNKLSNIIRVQKDKNLLSMNNNVIYKIDCNNCDASYVGQTKRKLQTRIREHKYNIRMDESKHSVVTNHILNYNHTFDWDNTCILDHEPNYHKRMISEMIHIKEQTNGINSNKDTELLDEVYFDILNELSTVR